MYGIGIGRQECVPVFFGKGAPVHLGAAADFLCGGMLAVDN